jgi:hypothetical protein
MRRSIPNSAEFRIGIILILLLNCFRLSSQDEPATIRFKKESNLAKAVLDNVNATLMVVDRFGNPQENKIVSYKLYVKARKETKEFTGYGNELTPEMVRYLNKLPSAAKIFFTEIQVRTDDEHLEKLPDIIETWFPDCRNCDSSKKRR